jgi:hypothetical protein
MSELKHDIETITEALGRIHRVATGDSDEAYMSIPANPRQDADLILSAAIRELEQLRAFKTYVHARLDGHGVPVDPESPHKAAGCRIGGRLDHVFAERDDLRAKLEASEASYQWQREHTDALDKNWAALHDGMGRRLEASEAGAAALREALEHIRENTPSQQTLEYDDGARNLGDYIGAALADSAGREWLEERKHDKAEVDFLRQRLQEAELDRNGYCRERDRARELLASTEAQVGSLIRQRDEARAERDSGRQDARAAVERFETEHDALRAELDAIHLPACRKRIYDLHSSPCTCLSEFNRLADENKLLRADLETEKATTLSRGEALEAAHSELEKAADEREALRSELAEVDAVLSRRTALDDEKPRVDKILKCIRTAAQVDALRTEKAKLGEAFAQMASVVAPSRQEQREKAQEEFNALAEEERLG